MYRKLSKLGAVKTDRNWSRSERNVGVSCTGGLLVARVPGCCATPRIPPGRKEVAIPHAYLAPGKVRNPNSEHTRRTHQTIDYHQDYDVTLSRVGKFTTALSAILERCQ